ncbi:MAG: putative lipoprotein [Acidobacteriaceae bacterium]|nr:putative lipoprotein [Acidobacteriaceae bacterium]
MLVAGSGCSKFKPKPSVQVVFVTAKQTFLRDRVAAVSNRTGTVVNGDRLEVLDHGRRFLKVKTSKGELGWIDEKAIANEQVYGLFDALKADHKNDLDVASAVVRDEVFLHARPGRDTERFFLLQEGTKLKMIARATVPKAIPGSKGTRAVAPVAVAPTKPGEVAEAPPPPPMEDWWLVRDTQGRTGWIFSRMIDVDAPDALTRYAEGQRIVGAYVLTTVHDDEAEMENKDVPIYVTVLSPYKAGLPYDFDQVRVFTWSLKKHRYETGFRDRNIEGYLPVRISSAKDPYGKAGAALMPAPTFTYRVLAAESSPVLPDPVTGAVVPGKSVLKTYRLEGNLVRRVMQPGIPAPMELHPVVVERKPGAGKGKGKKKR